MKRNDRLSSKLLDLQNRKDLDSELSLLSTLPSQNLGANVQLQWLRTRVNVEDSTSTTVSDSQKKQHLAKESQEHLEIPEHTGR